MKLKPEKKPKIFHKTDPLEVYLLAAENPIGHRQLRPFFRRKRNGEVLTREQVAAIKRGRKLLRKEMKERGLKRRIDFEVTAANLGLGFDRNKLFWPFFLWLIKDNTVAKILATTAVLTTTLTITEPVIEYVTQFVTQYVQQIVQEIVEELVPEYVKELWEKDRFTVTLSDDMLMKGLEVSDEDRFQNPSEYLTCVPALDMPCISISQIPEEVLHFESGENHDHYFAYTFYCRYINLEAERLAMGELDKDNVNGMETVYPLLQQYAIDYEWALMIGNESLSPEGEAQVKALEAEGGKLGGADGLQVSDALWAMVIEDDNVILCAKESSSGGLEKLPTDAVYEEKGLAFMDVSMDALNAGLGSIDRALSVNTVGSLDELYPDKNDREFISEQVDNYFDSVNLQPLGRLMLRTEDPKAHYKELLSRGNHSFYRVFPDSFESDDIIVSRQRTEVLPYLRPEKFTGDNEQVKQALEEQTSIHKYTVILWLEGDDPEAVNALMNGNISVNFQIKGDDEDFATEIVTPTAPTLVTDEA